jgi:hypothetical protein
MPEKARWPLALAPKRFRLQDRVRGRATDRETRPAAQERSIPPDAIDKARKSGIEAPPAPEDRGR